MVTNQRNIIDASWRCFTSFSMTLPNPRRQRVAAPAALPAQGRSPGYPDSMRSHYLAQKHMLPLCQATRTNDPSLSTMEACADRASMRQAPIAGGLGARCAPDGEREGQSPLAPHDSGRDREAGSARGKARSHPHHGGRNREAGIARGGARSQICWHHQSSREREGQSPLANIVSAVEHF
jgi:hypothetical protein